MSATIQETCKKCGSSVDFRGENAVREWQAWADAHGCYKDAPSVAPQAEKEKGIRSMGVGGG